STKSGAAASGCSFQYSMAYEQAIWMKNGNSPDSSRIFSACAPSGLPMRSEGPRISSSASSRLKTDSLSVEKMLKKGESEISLVWHRIWRSRSDEVRYATL